MSTVLIIVALLIYAGPCALMYLVGRRSGYDQGYADGQKSRRSDNDWGILNPGDGYRK